MRNKSSHFKANRFRKHAIPRDKVLCKFDTDHTLTGYIILSTLVFISEYFYFRGCQCVPNNGSSVRTVPSLVQNISLLGVGSVSRITVHLFGRSLL
jgi:hypothetical protein